MPNLGWRHRVRDLTGQQFGQYVVHSFAGYKGHQCIWNCVRECGCMVVRSTSQLCYTKTHQQCRECYPRARLMVRYAGRKTSLYRACRYLGLNYETLRKRMDNGETFEEAMTDPQRSRHNVYYTVGGLTMYRNEWAKRLGLNPQAIANRIADGWSEQEAVTTPRQKGGRGGIRWTNRRA